MFGQRKSVGRRLLTAAALLSVGAFQFALLPSCEGVLTTFNPGGTILGSVSAEDIDLLFADVPDWDYDPSCTIPGYGFDPANTSTGNCATQPIWPHTPGARP